MATKKMVLFFLLPVFFILSSLPSLVQPIPDQEFDTMLSSLRSHNYNLFSNAITTSDLRYELLAGTSFTLFAPTDSSLFALDMVATAFDYVASLRHHVVPGRYPASGLRSGLSLPTLLPHDDLLFISRNSTALLVNGVRVLRPGIFYGRNVAVHGLGSILSARSSRTHAEPPQPQILPFSNASFTPTARSFSPSIFMPFPPQRSFAPSPSPGFQSMSESGGRRRKNTGLAYAPQHS